MSQQEAMHLNICEDISQKNEEAWVSHSSKKLHHLAIIPDGNRRWAKQRGLSASEGHSHGFLSSAPSVIHRGFEQKIGVITLWLFSEDNWQRTDQEIDNLMKIYERFIKDLVAASQSQPFSICHIGRKDRIPASLLKTMETAIERTQQFQGCGPKLILALDYGGRSCFVRNVRSLIQEDHKNSQISDQEILARLNGYSEQIEPIDLVLRTSGEHRLSGFMPLQSAKAELMFLNKFFPDLCANDIDMVINNFSARHYRGGK